MKIIFSIELERTICDLERCGCGHVLIFHSAVHVLTVCILLVSVIKLKNAGVIDGSHSEDGKDGFEECQHIKIAECAMRKCLNSLSSRFYPEFFWKKSASTSLYSPTSPSRHRVSSNSSTHLSLGLRDQFYSYTC